MSEISSTSNCRVSKKEKYLGWWRELSEMSLDDFIHRVEALRIDLSEGEQYTQRAFSSGFGATVVAFVPPESRLYSNIENLMHFLEEDTKMGRGGRLTLNPLERVHLTIRGLVGKRQRDLPAKKIDQLQKAVQHAVKVFSQKNPAAAPIVEFENDICVSPRARINILGFQSTDCLLKKLSGLIGKEIEGLGLKSGKRKGDHISLASVTDDRVTQEELDDLRDKLAGYRDKKSEEGFGTLKIDRITFVHYDNSLLDRFDPESEKTYSIGGLRKSA